MSNPLPLIFGGDQDFATVRQLLTRHDFTAESVAARGGARSIYEFKAIFEGRTIGIELNDGLDVLIRLFMDSLTVPKPDALRLLGAEGIAALEALGLLGPARVDAQAFESPMLLYPAEGFWLVSDAEANPGRGTLDTTAADVVYPGITRNTGRFIAFQPDAPCDQMLELCGGTGLAALRASRFAKKAWTADITRRATTCAEFNIRLNGLTNVTAVQGDLYAPVKGQTFDLITAHPPYVPVMDDNKLIFRDAGQDGEQISRRIIEGAPEFLRPGGRLYCLCQATDRKGMLLERRVRQMLGPDEAEFDVLLVTLQEYDPLEYYTRSAVNGRETFARVGDWYALFKEIGIERLVYGMIVVERHASARPPITLRRQVAPMITPREVDWLLRWEAAAQGPGMPEALLEARPSAGAGVNMMMSMRQEGEEWMPVEVAFGTHWPFMLRVDAPVWAATLISQCNGARTVAELLGFFKENGIVEGNEGEASFLRLVQFLISAGILTVPAHPVPAIPPLAATA